MLKSTPGPWKVLPEEADRSYIRIRGTRLGGKYKIANVLVTNEFDVEEARANARLIEVVLELLEALRHAVEIAEGKIEGESWDDLIEYRSLIAKAEGRDA